MVLACANAAVISPLSEDGKYWILTSATEMDFVYRETTPLNYSYFYPIAVNMPPAEEEVSGTLYLNFSSHYWGSEMEEVRTADNLNLLLLPVIPEPGIFAMGCIALPLMLRRRKTV